KNTGVPRYDRAPQNPRIQRLVEACGPRRIGQRRRKIFPRSKQIGGGGMMLFVPLRDEATLDFSNVASRRRGHQPCHERLEYPVVPRHTPSGDRRGGGGHTMLT